MEGNFFIVPVALRMREIIILILTFKFKAIERQAHSDLDTVVEEDRSSPIHKAIENKKLTGHTGLAQNHARRLEVIGNQNFLLTQPS